MTIRKISGYFGFCLLSCYFFLGAEHRDPLIETFIVSDEKRWDIEQALKQQPSLPITPPFCVNVLESALGNESVSLPSFCQEYSLGVHAWEGSLALETFSENGQEEILSVEDESDNEVFFQGSQNLDSQTVVADTPLNPTPSFTTYPRRRRAAFIFAPSVNTVVGSGIGYEGGYATIGGMVFNQNLRFQPFVAAFGHYLFHNEWAANFGVGARHLWPNEGLIIGYNLFYDLRQDSRYFQEIGFGLEFLGRFFDLRLNGYFPIRTTKKPEEKQLFTYPGGYWALNRPFKEMLRGGDVEITAFLGRWLHSALFFEPYISLSSYYFAQSVSDDFVGARVTVGVNYLDYAYAEVRVSHDSQYKTLVQGVFSLTLPFEIFAGGYTYRNRDPLYRKMIIPVKRQEVMIKSKKQCHFKTNY